MGRPLGGRSFCKASGPKVFSGFFMIPLSEPALLMGAIILYNCDISEVMGEPFGPTQHKPGPKVIS